MGERPRPGDGREHGDGQRVGDREQAAGGAHEPSGRAPRPGRPGGPSLARSGLARLPLCPSGTAPVNAEFFTPDSLLNARPALTLPAATVPPTRERRPGRAGVQLSPHLQKSGFGGPFSLPGPKSGARGAGLIGCYGSPVYPAWSILGPFVYLRFTPGCLSAGPRLRTTVVCQPSLFTPGEAWRAGNTLVCTWTRLPPLPGPRWRPAGVRFPAGVQRLGLRAPERRHGGRGQLRQPRPHPGPPSGDVPG
jgi:hypothetical protein